MIGLFKLFLKLLPWMLTVGLLGWMLLEEKRTSDSEESTTETVTQTLLSRSEQMGKIELVRYSFQEITEIKKIAKTVDLKLFKYKLLPDSKGVLISQGSAVGCIDIGLLTIQDISVQNDTITVQLPAPELCYFKINLEKTRLYDLEVDYLRAEDRKEFIQHLYKAAEQQIEESAYTSGILEETIENAHVVLRPILESITGKVVLLTFSPATENITTGR